VVEMQQCCRLRAHRDQFACSPCALDVRLLVFFFCVFVAHDADNRCKKEGRIVLAKAIVQVPCFLHLMNACHCAVDISRRRLWYEILETTHAFHQVLVDFNEEERVFLFLRHQTRKSE